MLGGKRSWAVEIALAFGLMMATAAVLAYLGLWAAPWTVRSRMDAWSFLSLRQAVLECGEAIVFFHVRLGLGVGAVVGAITGRLIAVAGAGRGWRDGLPRPACGVRIRTGAANPFRRGDFLGNARPLDAQDLADHREHVWATAVIFGAFTGAFVACLAMQLARWHRSRHVSRTAVGAPGVARSRAREYVEG